MSEWQQKKLESYLDHQISLGRGEIISKGDIAAEPGPYPIYSSSAHNNGKFGEYGKFMFDEELVTWSVDGGGYFFYRPKHKFSVTNVCGFMRIRDEQLNAKFIFYCLSNQHKHLTFDYTTKAHPSVIKKLYSLPDVDYEQQKRIADILTSIDQTIEKTEALIEKYQLIKAGLMHDLFTRGITAEGKLRPSREQAPELYQETATGWVPKEWCTRKIGELFHIQLGKMLSQISKTGKNSAYYLGNKNVQWDYIEFDHLEVMDFSLSEREKFKLIDGDLLVCEGGDVGRTSLWRGELKDCFYQKAVHRLRALDNEIHPAFMLRFMRYAKETGMFINYTSQTSIAHLTQEKLSEVEMFKPSYDEQVRMIERFDGVDNRLKTETQLKNKLLIKKSGLMHDLLTGKVPVTPDEKASHV